MYLSYLQSLELDDFAHWNKRDFEYYNKVSFPIKPEVFSREGMYKQLREAA